MIPRLADIRHASGYRVRVRFEEGREGEIDLEGELWSDVFEPLKERDLFKTVELNRKLNKICWENGRTSLPSSCTRVSPGWTGEPTIPRPPRSW